MIATLFRFISWFVLAGGVIVAIVDATRSVAANSLQLTKLGDMLEVYAPAVTTWLDAWKTSVSGTQTSNWSASVAIDYLTAVPVALLAAGLFLLIYGLASRDRETRHF